LELYDELRHFRFSPCVFRISDQSVQEDTLRLLLPVENKEINVRPSIQYDPLRPDCVDLKAIQTWIEECDANHGQQCTAKKSRAPALQPLPLPGFKVIDCATNFVVPWSLCQPYVALSYVWGHNQQSRDNVAFSDRTALPKTIQDAMTVVLRLGYRHIWVDKYCIDQTDVSQVHHQTSAMDRIYQNADLTIIAGAGNDANFGLPGLHPGSRAPQPRLVLNGITWVSLEESPFDVVKSSVWNTRAWTYQEGYFARKRLIFTEDLVLFQCNQSCHLEISRPPCAKILKQELNQEVPVSSEPLEFVSWTANVVDRPESNWRILEILEACSKRQLSFGSDAIRAVQGVLSSRMATQLSEIANGIESDRFVHYWGTPITIAPYAIRFKPNTDVELAFLATLNLEEQLYGAISFGCSWSSSRVGEPTRRNDFPSWTWAGWKTHVSWQDQYYESPRFLDTDMPTLVCIQQVGGEYQKLDEDFMQILIQSPSHQNTLYTHQLSIETTILKVKLSCSGDDEQIPRFDIIVPLSRVKAESIPNGLADDLPNRWDAGELGWDVDITPHVKRGSQLHTELCTERFECAVMFGHYGLLLRTRDGVSERIGVIRSLDATLSFAAHSVKEYKDVNKSLPHGFLCLQSHVPIRKGRILLE
jgi:hypothetical protein